ncbi:MAG: hypothetical protein KHY83_06715 [Coriobacteriia bacterium]|nr:hypothetical protein [Coriobacteriia bacterium]MBS5478340.1 hypothetical protein [Coriobacteriia bacterium]
MKTLKISGECVFIKDESEGRWSATFPQYNHMATSGDTLEEAMRLAQDCLRLEALTRLDDGESGAVEAQHVGEVRVLSVEVNEEELAESKCLSRAEAADLIGVSRQRVGQLVRDGRLATRMVGASEMVTKLSAMAYRDSVRGPGRKSGQHKSRSAKTA